MKAIKYFFLLLVIAVFTAIEAEAQLVVIVHNDNPVGNLDEQGVKDYYMRKNRSRWPKLNKQIKPVDRKGSSSERSQFLADVLGMSNEKLSQYFTQRQFANSEAPPVKFSSDSEVVSYVSSEAGAIGFISLSAYEANKSKVKAVLIIK